MAAMTKRVNINAPVAIRNITPPIYGVCKNVIMSTGDILKCLCKRAIVDEILLDGSTVRLNMRNYYTDNGAGLDASVIDAAKEEFVGQSAAQDKEPAAAIVVNTDQTNVSGVVNTHEEDAASDEEDTTIVTGQIVVSESEEVVSDLETQTEDHATNEDTEESTTVTTEEESDNINTKEDKNEEVAKEDNSDTEVDIAKEEKSETSEKKPVTKSTSSTKKKNTNSSSKKKTTSTK